MLQVFQKFNVIFYRESVHRTCFVLCIWNNALIADVAGACVIGGTKAGLASALGVLSISDIIQFSTMTNQALLHN